MLKSIGIGAELFHKLIENDCYYVDKTPFIRTVFKENKADVMLITRPRRFGKTLTMSTFYDFLSLNIENPGDVSFQENWFKDTKIFEDKEFCREYMGKYPVIFITLKQIEGKDFISAYGRFASAIYDMYTQFRYLADSDKLSSDEIEEYKLYLDKFYLREPKNNDAVKDSLSTLLKLLNKHHGIKPILLIDEYDVPIAKAAHNGYYREMIDIISPFLSKALKTNVYLGRAVLTGCLRAAKKSIFTGLNNLLVCSILDSGDDEISQGIGFTREESEEVLAYYGLSDYYEEARNNYDGYHFGTTHMYCPWDVMNFCDMMQDLLDGKSITAEVRTSLCYGDLQNHDIDDFWTLLLYTGYLTFEPQSHNPENDEYSLFIPNEEIRKCFKSKILNFFKTNSVMKTSTGELVKGLFEGDAEKVQDNLNTLLGKYVSIRDFSVESGDGYVDIIIASKNSDTVAILELKQTDKPFGARLIAAQKAVEQITEKGYATVYMNDPLVRNVYAYGICFHKKSCSVVVKKMK